MNDVLSLYESWISEGYQTSLVFTFREITFRAKKDSFNESVTISNIADKDDYNTKAATARSTLDGLVQIDIGP